MSQPPASSKTVIPSSQTPQPSATTNVFSRQVQSPPPPTAASPPAPSAALPLRAKTVQYQQAGMPYMSGVQGPPVEPEPWYSRSTNYCCYLPLWAGAIIWLVASLMTVLLILRAATKSNPV